MLIPTRYVLSALFVSSTLALQAPSFWRRDSPAAVGAMALAGSASMSNGSAGSDIPLDDEDTADLDGSNVDGHAVDDSDDADHASEDPSSSDPPTSSHGNVHLSHSSRRTRRARSGLSNPCRPLTKRQNTNAIVKCSSSTLFSLCHADGSNCSGGMPVAPGTICIDGAIATAPVVAGALPVALVEPVQSHLPVGALEDAPITLSGTSDLAAFAATAVPATPSTTAATTPLTTAAATPSTDAAATPSTIAAATPSTIAAATPSTTAAATPDPALSAQSSAFATLVALQ